jgi:hypothetical protein
VWPVLALVLVLVLVLVVLLLLRGWVLVLVLVLAVVSPVAVVLRVDLSVTRRPTSRRLCLPL